MWYIRQSAIVLLLMAVTSLTACDLFQDDEGETPGEEIDPQVEIQQIVDTFLQEAAQRGRTDALYRPSDLQIIVQDEVVHEGNELCGLGGANPDTELPEIFIATSDNCWDRSAWDKEILVFHELGHALLGGPIRRTGFPTGCGQALCLEVLSSECTAMPSSTGVNTI